jgi:hypothetical protein
LTTLDDTQRVVVLGPGPRSTRLSVLVLEVTDAAKARTFIGDLLTERDHRVSFHGFGPHDRVRAFGCRVAIGFTHQGLVALGRCADELATFPLEFRQGPAQRAAIVGDVGPNAPEHWLDVFGHAGHRIDVVLFVWEVDGSHVGELRKELAQGVGLSLRAALQGRRLVRDDDGNLRAAQLDDEKRQSHEPFGFADPRAQPWIVDLPPRDPDEDPDPARQARLGEFVLGAPGDLGAARQHYVPGDGQVEAEARLGYYGTFGALRVMRQDVELAKEMRYLEERVGLTRDGHPLPQPPHSMPGGDDPRGPWCPVGSHVRRANPLDGPQVNRSPSRRWLLRRGMPYGASGTPPLLEDLDGEQGLIGLFLCASLADQYEGVLGEWMNRGIHHPELTGTDDPLVGYVSPEGRPLVTTRGVAYLFFPARQGIALLAAGAA